MDRIIQTIVELPPQSRARSNTWPFSDEINGAGGEVPPANANPVGQHGPIKKNSSRRNAWGNLSYADLITQAIGSSPEKRLTLSQIYEWMVQNVTYFKDKGDSNSSAGWKNSIRHNLSLHNRFMRVQNEGTGKSSWWVINPDAKPGKSARRRAASMETSKYEKRRGRVKKKVEALANGLGTPSPSSSISESNDMFPDSPFVGYQLSPDFRPRASSNGSSSSRLSPIVTVESSWGQTQPTYYEADQLAGSLEQTMRLGVTAENSGHYMYPNPPPPYQDQNHFIYQPQNCSMHVGPQPCGCLNAQNTIPRQSISPTYPQSQSPSPPAPATMMGQLMGALNPSVFDDLNLNIETFHGGFDCNVDEVIKHELRVEGNLDFNFTQQPPTTTAQDQKSSPFSGQSWVH